MDIKHFNHLVQVRSVSYGYIEYEAFLHCCISYFAHVDKDTLLQLLAHSIQQGKLGGASSKTDLWGTLLESYLKEQCSVFMEASEQCAVLRRMGGGSRGGMGQRDQPQMQHEQHQQEREWGEHMEALEEAQEYDAIMCCVDRVQFLSTPCTFSCTCCCPPPSTTTAATTAATAGRQKGSSSAGSGSGSGGSTSRDLMGRPSAASALLLPPVPCVAADPRVQHKQRDAGVHSRQHQPQHQPQHQHQHQHQHQMMSRPESPPPPPPPLLTSPALPSVRSLQPQPPPPPAHGDSRGKMCSAGGAIFEELPQRSPTVVHAPLDMSNGVLRQSPGDCESSWAAEQQIIQRTRERNSARYDQLLRTTLHKPSTVTLVPASSSGPAAAHPIRLTSNNISGSVPTLSSPAFSNSAPACGASLPAPAAGRRLALNSKLLPPQQEDPEPANVDHTQQSSSAPTVCRTGVNVDTSLDRTVAAARRDLPQQYEEQEQDRQSSLVAAAESAQFQSEVNDFLRRSLQSELALAVVAAEGIAEGEVREKGGADQLEAEERDGKEEEDPLLDLAFSQEMESRWLLSAQSISAYLTSSDQARDITDSREQRAEGSHLATTAIPAAAAAEGSSIAALKAQITCQNNKYLLSQRTEYALYGLHRALWDAVETFGEQSLALAKTAESHFSVRRKEIESVRQDASFGFTCLKGHRTALNNAQVVLHHSVFNCC